MIWRKQYLLQLRENHALKSKRQNRHPVIVVDNIVILKDQIILWTIKLNIVTGFC